MTGFSHLRSAHGSTVGLQSFAYRRVSVRGLQPGQVLAGFHVDSHVREPRQPVHGGFRVSVQGARSGKQGHKRGMVRPQFHRLFEKLAMCREVLLGTRGHRLLVELSRSRNRIIGGPDGRGQKEETEKSPPDAKPHDVPRGFPNAPT